MKNQYRISKINNLYSKIILCSKKLTPEYYANLRKSLILEKLTGMLTSEVNFESCDRAYYTFDHEDFKILHTMLTNDANLQNGTEYLYGIVPYLSEKNNKKIIISRLIIKIGIDQYLYFASTSSKDVYAEVIFFEEPSEEENEFELSNSTPSLEEYENSFSDTIDWEKFKNDKVILKLTPRPTKIFNILEYISENINEDLLSQNNTEEKVSDIYTFKDFIKDTNVPICEKVPVSVFTEPRPNIKCKDGFSFSVQASYYNACEPKLTGLDLYKSYEVLSKNEIDDFMLYLSNDNFFGNNKTHSSISEYNFVPLELIENFIDSHGGIDKDATFKAYEKNRPSELKRLSYAKKIMENNL